MKILDVLTSPWAIAPEKLAEIKSIYRAHFAGEKIDWKNIEAKLGISSKRAKDAPLYRLQNGVAIIDVEGVLTKKLSFFSFLFGGTTTPEIAAALEAALADDATGSILLSIDSPGGTVDGTQELAEKIYAARGKKPIVAYSDGQVTSAAYWIASAADKVYLSGGTVVAGSIGVVATHVDYSKMDEMHGVKVTEITAGKYKRIYSENAPLSPEGRQTLQDEVDYLYSVFVNDVARNRGVFVEDALTMADGKIFFGQQAVDAGLADGIITMEGLINKMAGGAPGMYAINHQAKEDTDVDLKTLKEKYPELYKAAVDEGRAEAKSEAEVLVASAQEGHAQEKAALTAQVAAAEKSGAEKERARIKEIQTLAIPGHEKIIEEAIASGTSVEETAKKLVVAEKALKETKLAALAEDGKSLKIPATDGKAIEDEEAKRQAAEAKQKAQAKADDETIPVEERAKAQWDADENIRKEFAFGGYAAFLAFKKNEKNVRIKGQE